MPKLCLADGLYNGTAGSAALAARIRDNPFIIKQAKQFMLSNIPQIAPSSQRLPYTGKARGSIGKARGVGLRNLRPLNRARTTVAADTDDSDLNNGDAYITPGREFSPKALWNTWLDAYYFDMQDRRYNLQFDGDDSLLVFGTDRLLRENLALGMLASIQKFNTTGFGGNWITDSNELTIGPYLGYQVSKIWAINTSLGYGNTHNNVDIANFNGSYIAHAYSFEIDLIGQYDYKKLHLLVKPALFYSYVHTKAYQVSGSIAGVNLNIPVSNDSFSVGLVATSIEMNRDFRITNFKILEPFADIGVIYAFQRPNNGKILTGNLYLASTSAWSGTARIGARLLLASDLYIAANGGYLSIGQAGLNIWEARVYTSYVF